MSARVSMASFGRQAACRDRTDEMIPPEGLNSAHYREFTTRAREICRGCPVLEQCRVYTLSLPEVPTIGVWAGMTRDDIAKIRRNRDRRRVA